ncbi:MFS transporter [Acetobacter musti]|nr:MFS transporter [Acetobacter musti]
MTRAMPEYRRASLALFLSGFATFSLLYCVQPLLPVFSDAFGITPASSSLSLSVSTISLAIAILFAAPLAERFGRRELIFAALLASSVLNIAAGIAPDWTVMLVLRALEGATLGGVPAVAMTYLAEEIEPAELAAAMGLYIAGNALGGMIGRIGCGVLTEYVGWRAAMGLMGAVDLAAAVAFIVLLPRSRHFLPRGRLGARYHMTAWANHLFRSALPAVYLTGALLMGAFVTIFNYAGYRLTAPPFDFSQTQQGLLFSVYIFGVGASSLAGILSDRIGRQRVLPAGIVTMMTGILLTMTASVPVIVIGISLLTIGFFASHAVASGWVGRLAKTDRGHASSLYLLCYYMGAGIAGSAGGWFWSSWRWPGITGFTLAMLTVAMGAALWLAERVRRAA